MPRTPRQPIDPVRRRGLARVTPVNVGLAVLGGAATVGIAAGLASARPADATGSRAAVAPPSVPSGAAPSSAPAPGSTGLNDPAAPATPKRHHHHSHVSPGGGGQPTAQSHGS